MTKSAMIHGVAVAGTLLLSAFPALAQVHTTYLWHMQQPIYWPEQSEANPHRYQTAWESHQLKFSGGNTYSDGLAHPLNDLASIFGNDDRKAAYQFRPKDAVQSLLAHPEGGACVNYGGCLIENVNSLAAAGQWGYNNGWQNDFTTARNWTTSGGNRRMDITAFGFHHVMAPLVSKEVLRKEIRMHRHIYEQTFGPGYSKGFWPAECGFSERIIPVLVEEGLEWSVVANSHLARTLSDYPVIFGTNGCNIDPPNPADVVPTAGNNWWSGQLDGRGGQFAAPYCYQAHRAQHIDPETGEAAQLVVVPMADLLSYQNGFSTMGTGDIDAHIAPYDNPAHPSLVLMAHDGDNAWGGGYDYYANSVPGFANAAAAAGHVPTTVQQFLDDHPVPANDLVHVEDGAWFNAANDWGHPQFINWFWPLYDNSTYTFDPNGWTEDARNWAVLTAAENHVQMAEDLEGPVDIADLVSPSASSSLAEKAWHFLLPGFTSGYMYYGTAIDMEVKQTLAANNALGYANQVLNASPGIDNTAPSVLVPQRYPWNPGGVGFGPHYGYQQHANSSDFAVWTFAYDVSGVGSAQVKYRLDLDGVNPLADSDNDTYAGGPGVGDWMAVDMDVANVPTGNVTGNGDIDFFILPDAIADLYHATLTGIEEQLVDYYVEITDVHGNVHKSDIQHVYVGACNGCAVEGGGCTDPAANNFDEAATVDDASCVYDFVVAVDMSNEGSISPAGVHIAGEFQGWNASGTPLTSQGDGVWSATVEVPSGPFLCKFLNGNAWGSEEVVPFDCGLDDGVGSYNRIISWNPSTGNVMDPVCFGACSSCIPDTTGGGGGPLEYSLTIQVNMEGLNVSAAGMHIAGTWQGWDAGTTPMTQVAGTDVWAYTTTFLPGTYIKYKFINGNAWGQDESVPGACADGIDRFHTTGSTDAVLDPVCYGTCTTCLGPDPDPTCLGDLNGDGLLNVPDMLTLLADFGCEFTCESDLDGDGSVTVSDILELLTLFGETCP